MSAPTLPPSPPAGGAAFPSQERTLRRLFLTLFLRGRSSRGLQRERTPKSVGTKLARVLFYYAAFGCLALALIHQPVFALAAYLHAMTLVFLGLFVASSAGEILFNEQEAEILLHRPVSARALLRAKVWVLVEVSLWLAAAFQLVGLFVGIVAPDGGWRFPVVHALSSAVEATFCTGCVIMVYQLCLRFFGRERLDSLMTAAQVLVSLAAVLSGQLLPQALGHAGKIPTIATGAWWLFLLPPAWFAGVDDALAGSGASGSWLLGGLALIVTAAVLVIAFGKLATDYGTGLQRLSESTAPPPAKAGRRRWIDRLATSPPLSWWLRDPVTRASFSLTAAYLLRDRDVKLRLYPGIAPMLLMPIVILMGQHGQKELAVSEFSIAFSGGFVGLVPLMGLSMLQYSQHWQAADIFRIVPLAGPGRICAGARRAVLCFLTLPVAAAVILIVALMPAERARLLLLLPGLIALPVYALAANMQGQGIPLSLPTEESKSTSRGLTLFGIMIVSMILSGLASFSWSTGWFGWFVLGEAVAVIVVYVLMHAAISRAPWPSME